MIKTCMYIKDGKSVVKTYDTDLGYCTQLTGNRNIVSPYRMALSDGRMGEDAYLELSKPQYNGKTFAEILPYYDRAVSQFLNISNYKPYPASLPIEVDPETLYKVRKRNPLYPTKWMNFRYCPFSEFWWGILGVEEWLKERNFNADLYITGDSAGSRHESTASRTDWQIIEGLFKSFRGFKGVFVRRTKKIRDRVNNLNALFNNTLNEKRLFVNKDECPQLHNDLMRVQWRSNSMELDDQGGKLTHASDALSYLAYNFESMEEKAITRL